MVKTKKKKQLTPEQVAHRKFLEKMGVTKVQLKARKIAREQDSEENSGFRPDTRDSVRRAYDD